MKTLADLKRKLRIGMTLDVKHYNGWTPGPRKLAHTDSVDFGFLNPETNQVSYCRWPLAKDLEIINDNEFIVWSKWHVNGKETRVPLLHYTIL